MKRRTCRHQTIRGFVIGGAPLNLCGHRRTRRVYFHELAHIELGHTTDPIHDSETLPRNLKEVEAEAVALLCLESLGMDGAEYCRGYIQNWLQGETIPERTAHCSLHAYFNQGSRSDYRHTSTSIARIRTAQRIRDRPGIQRRRHQRQ